MQAKICLCAVLYNEASNVSSLIAHLHGLVDYVLLSDVGSSDETLEMVKKTLKMLALEGVSEVRSNNWVDFSTNRNMLLDAVPPWITHIIFLESDQKLIVAPQMSDRAIETFKVGLLPYDVRFCCSVSMTKKIKVKPVIFKNDRSLRFAGLTSPTLKIDAMNHKIAMNLDDVQFCTDNGQCLAKMSRVGRKVMTCLNRKDVKQWSSVKLGRECYLGLQYMRLKQPISAMAWFEKRCAVAFDASEEAWYAYYMKGHCHKAIGNLVEAETIFRIAHLRRSSRAEPIEQLVRLLVDLGRVEEAQSLAKVLRQLKYPTSDRIGVNTTLYHGTSK